MKNFESNAADVLHRITASDVPFAIYRHQNNPGEIVIAEGDMSIHDYLDDIPRSTTGVNTGDVDTISAIPYNQIRERGFDTVESDARIQTMNIHRISRFTLQEVLELLPKEAIELRNGIRLDKTDEEYAQMVADIQQNQIGKGEGANFVVPRTAEADIENFNRQKALSIFRSLVENEFGSYMTFAFSNGEDYLIGASPERHLTVEGGEVGMTPISGTFRKEDGTVNKEKLMQFLRDPKEQHELFMVLDEELKMMAQMCKRGGMVEGPFLREMRKVLHTEYTLTGHSDLDVMELFKHSMYAPTVTGSPIKNACRVICEYDPEDRRYYSSALLFLGTDEQGQEKLDSAITIRTMEINREGHVTVKAGATLVQGSDPMEEANETTAKAEGALLGLQAGTLEESGPQLPEVMDEEVQAALLKRNEELSPYFFRDLEDEDLTVETFCNKEVTVVASDDDFAHILGHMMTKMGATVNVVDCMEYESLRDEADLVLVGPGTGDPNNMNHPKMQKLNAILTDLNHSERSFAAVCLGHQMLAKTLGMHVSHKEVSTQGVAKNIHVFSEQQRVGFYNTFTALHKDIPGVEVSYDAETLEVHAMRGEHFVSFQFHPESVLSKDGFEILKSELVSLLERSAHE